MKAYPLIRTKWSNEYVMLLLYAVLLFYYIPQWIKNPEGSYKFLLLLAAGLLIDAVFHLIRYKRMWCCVSAAVTAAMISILAHGVPFMGQLLGVASALIIGKQIWGGTGKNMVNPAMFGLLTIMAVYRIPYPYFPASYLFLPAVILSIPFIKSRPFAGSGLMIGMIASLILTGDLSILSLITHGVFFWSCLVITDPVTVTKRPFIGMFTGILAGAAAIFIPSPVTLVIGIIAVNLISALIETIPQKRPISLRTRSRLSKVVNNLPGAMIDLSGEINLQKNKEFVIPELSSDEIMKRIKKNEVFGMGGAAFSTYQKLLSVSESKEIKKYLIINGVECDPGLVHDNYLLHNFSNEICKGIEILRKCVSFDTVYIAVKNTAGLHFPEDIILYKVPNAYPIGAEKILISEILKDPMGKNEIPAESGILVLNVQTVYSIFTSVTLDQPVTTRLITVANLIDRTAKVVKIRLGMKVHDIMEAVYPGMVNVFAGGGLMQAYRADEDAVADRNVNFLAAGMFPKYKESPQCSKCGACTDKCPAGLKVNLIADLVDHGKLKETLKYHATDCIGCGSCSYYCLAGRNLSAKVKAAKEAV